MLLAPGDHHDVETAGGKLPGPDETDGLVADVVDALIDVAQQGDAQTPAEALRHAPVACSHRTMKAAMASR